MSFVDDDDSVESCIPTQSIAGETWTSKEPDDRPAWHGASQGHEVIVAGGLKSQKLVLRDGSVMRLPFGNDNRVMTGKNGINLVPETTETRVTQERQTTGRALRRDHPRRKVVRHELLPCLSSAPALRELRCYGQQKQISAQFGKGPHSSRHGSRIDTARSDETTAAT